MKLLSPILALSLPDGVMFHCPGCEEMHRVGVSADGQGSRPRWKYNYRPSAPTFQPSILVTYNGADAGQVDEDGFRAPPAVCHSFVTRGQIQFLPDCTHHLAGQTVPLPPIPARDAG